MAPRTVGGVCKVHVGSRECKNIYIVCEAWAFLECAAPSLGSASVGAGVSPRSITLRLRWQVRMAPCGIVCGVRPGGRVPCVAAGAVLERAVLERASSGCAVCPHVPSVDLEPTAEQTGHGLCPHTPVLSTRGGGKGHSPQILTQTLTSICNIS